MGGRDAVQHAAALRYPYRDLTRADFDELESPLLSQGIESEPRLMERTCCGMGFMVNCIRGVGLG